MKKLFSLIFIGAFSLAFTGCSGAYDNTQAGTALGAVTGAVVGYNTGNKHSGRNAAIGAATGAVAGGLIGNAVDTRQELERRSSSSSWQ